LGAAPRSIRRLNQERQRPNCNIHILTPSVSVSPTDRHDGRATAHCLARATKARCQLLEKKFCEILRQLTGTSLCIANIKSED
jgi:hypothetical protein